MVWLRSCVAGVLSWVLAGAASAGATPKSPDEAAVLTRSLEAMAHRGEISDADLHRLREKVYERWPEARGALPPRVLCGNQAVRDARAFAREAGAPMLRFPPPYSDFVDSPTYPIRVHHDGDPTTAQVVLAAAEAAWNAQIDVVGYPAPHTDGDEGPIIPGIWYYVADAGGAAAYAEPLADIASTPNCDCSCRIVVDPINSPAELPVIIAHEFNHATQMATDCTEAISAFENFATAVMTHYFPEQSQPLFLISYFQTYPEWPVDYWTRDFRTPSSDYQYGAALFPLYLDARFGARDLTFLRDVWNGFAQQGSVDIEPGFDLQCSAGNTPDWFEGLAATLARRRATDLDDAFDEFSTWRAVAGPYDDGAHFPNGASYPAASTTEMSLASLPASVERSIHEYGSMHVLLADMDEAPVDVQVTVDPGATFGASLLLWHPTGTVDRIQAVFDGTTAVIPAASFENVTRAVVVVSQRSAGSHDPDLMEYFTTRTVQVSVARPAGSDPDAGVAFDARVDPDVDFTSPDGAVVDGLVPAPRGCACRLGAPDPPITPWPLAALALCLFRRRTGSKGGQSPRPTERCGSVSHAAGGRW